MGSDKKYCYEFSKQTFAGRYQCCGCIISNNHTNVSVKNFGTDDEVLQLYNDNPHVCEPREYESLEVFREHQIVRRPDYEIQKVVKNGIETKTLVLFEPGNRDLCYKYAFCEISQRFMCNSCHYHGHFGVIAKIQVDENGSEYAELRRDEHICMLQTYRSEDELQDIIIEGKNYGINKEITD